MSSLSPVVVWEWHDDHGFWIPYKDTEATRIENQFRVHSVNSCSLSPLPYEIVFTRNGGASGADASNGYQRNVASGNRRNVRRTVLPGSDPLIGVMWKWSGDVKFRGGAPPWIFYPTEISRVIEKALQLGSSSVNLENSFSRFRYTIDLISNLQKNNLTGFSRKVERETGLQYPLDASSVPSNTNPLPSGNTAVGFRRGITTASLPSSTSIVASSSSASTTLSTNIPKLKRRNGDVNANSDDWRLASCSPPSVRDVKINNNDCTPRSSSTTATLNTHSNVVEIAAITDNEVDCGICMDVLRGPSGFGDPGDNVVVSQLRQCRHVFHQRCLHAMVDAGNSTDGLFLQCPTCKRIHGEKRGVCPNGTMSYRLERFLVPGHEADSDGAVRIDYHVFSGVQGAEHPHPGRPFHLHGFPRRCYLPNSVKGRFVLQLLIVAWRRRLTFSVGVSSTSGIEDCVTWNEIHHKTEPTSNHSGHGYPDPNYLDNVVAELAVHGVTYEDLPVDEDDGSGSSKTRRA